MLELENLTVAYGRITVVHGISISVTQGETVAMIGPNGAGKSTTLNTVAGLLRPQSGRIVFRGKDIAGMVPERIAREGISLVPEGRRVFGRLTVEENLKLGTTIPGLRSSRDDIAAALQWFPVLERYFNKPAAALSGGEQQQLAIARALMSRPSLLLVDEPSLGLSPIMISKVFEALKEIATTRELTVLMVEQSMRLALEFADRSYVVRTGSIELETDASGANDMDAMEAAYFGTA